MSTQVIAFQALGVPWSIKLDADSQTRLVVASEIAAMLQAFDKAYSRFRDDSIVAQIASTAGSYQLPNNAEQLLAVYAVLYQLTTGAFTPLIGQTLVDAGYDQHYTLKQQRPLSPPPAWEDVMSYDFPTLTVKQPALLDFGAAGKGYAIDLIADILRRHEISSFVIDGSGDLWHEGNNESVTIGLEDPTNPDQVLAIASLQGNLSLCGSSGSRRQWDTFTHILNPTTLTSPTAVLATWVVADSALIADAIATALFLAEPRRLLEHFSFEYFILLEDRSVVQSPHFPAEPFLQ